MNSENRNYILAIALSILVLVGWQLLIGIPQMRKQQAAQQAAQQTEQAASSTQDTGTQPQPGAAQPGTATQPTVGTGAAVPGGQAAVSEASRAEVLASTARVPIKAPDVTGSINLKGARIDDLSLTHYHETVDKTSPIITLLSPSGSPHPYYVELGWTVAPGSDTAVPTAQTEWTAPAGATLTVDTPVELTWDNGAGLIFHRTFSVDEHYMFTVDQRVENTTEAAVTLYPYGLVSRHGKPETRSFYILHEGLLGVLGETGLHEIKYDKVVKDGPTTVKATGGWLGITDKYWATTLIPDQKAEYQGRFSANTSQPVVTYQSDYLLDPVTVAPGATGDVTTHVFAGAKQVKLINAYEDTLNIERFDLMIDWGWFYFITKPMFTAIHFFHQLFGNFGIAILVVTVIVKLIFFPLANKSYASMSRMKLVQPEMTKIRERFADDKQKQQQAMMELYKKEKINPLSGCLPIVVQIPVFFSLYKVLFVTIEMRHAPFFGWIHDLSAPDPTTVFNLFGLIPWDPPSFLLIGIWPLIMGVTMFVQMKLNPAPPDPTQAMIFTWMPIFFTFLLASFPAGLVIYWAWNNTLSILQQYTIMRRQGVKVELWDNIKSTFKLKAKSAGKG